MNYWRVKVGEAIIHLPEVNCYLRLSCLYFDSALSFMWTPECLDLSSVCFCNTRQKKPTLFFSSSSALPLLVIWTLLLLFLCWSTCALTLQRINLLQSQQRGGLQLLLFMFAGRQQWGNTGEQRRKQPAGAEEERKDGEDQRGARRGAEWQIEDTGETLHSV